MSRERSQALDSLELQRQRFNSMHEPNSVSSKSAIQQLYRQQLDALITQKAHSKQAERAQREQERREFNLQVEQGKEAEKNKEVSYKNYYQQLSTQQAQKQDSYVSPFSKADRLKAALIEKGIDEDRQRYLNADQQLRLREAHKRNQYRDELLHQIQERRDKEASLRQLQLQDNETLQMQAKGPQELAHQEREKKRKDIEKYREDLDTMARGRSSSQTRDTYPELARPQYHNILTNPLPYNIQNPYILKQMGRNPSYLAMKGSQHLQQP